MVFYVESLYIAKSIHAYSPSLPSFSGSEMGIAPPPLALHIFPGVARLSATSNIKHPCLGACHSLPRSLSFPPSELVLPSLGACHSLPRSWSFHPPVAIASRRSGHLRYGAPGDAELKRTGPTKVFKNHDHRHFLKKCRSAEEA